jgi:hypothetical protein
VSATALDARWRAAAWALCAATAAWAAWAFAPILGGYFISDDFVPLVLFRLWEEQGRLGAMLASKFWSSLDAGESHFYRPLSYLSFALNYWLSGTDPRSWMALNVLIHVLNAAMVGAIGAYAADAKPGARAAACGAAGAALFLFLAPATEVVAWISGRFDGSATFFTLLACLLFLKSRRSADTAWWLSLAAALAAFLCKESAAIVPFAILFLARLRPDALEQPARAARWIAAARHAAPWLVLSALYLAGRYLMFGSATRVYGDTQPLATLFSSAYWHGVLDTFPVWLSAQFRPTYRYPFLCALTLLQLAIIAFARPREARAREAIFGAAAITAITLLLLAPHVGKLPEDGLSGRLLYQSSAFYGVLAAIALRHARLKYLLWGVTLALVLLHAGFQRHAIARWSNAFVEMRALVPAIKNLHDGLAPADYALVLAPGGVDDIPFARNAQGGLMLPPIYPAPMSARLLVQQYDEIPLLPGKLREGVVSSLKRQSVFDYLAGKRVTTASPEYPTVVVCWSLPRRSLVRLAVAPGPDPEAWAQAVQRALAASACAQKPSSR